MRDVHPLRTGTIAVGQKNVPKAMNGRTVSVGIPVGGIFSVLQGMAGN